MVTPRIHYPDSPQRPDQPSLPGQPPYPYPETPIPGQPPGTSIPGQPPLPGTSDLPGRPPVPETPIPASPHSPAPPRCQEKVTGRSPWSAPWSRAVAMTVTALRRVTAPCDGHQDRLGHDRR